MKQPRTFPADDEISNVCKSAATMSRFKFHGNDREFLPSASSEAATVSFIEIKEKTYAVTARHVIQVFTKLAKKEGKEHEGYFCPQSPGVAILGPFLTPTHKIFEPKPDIAICPLKKGVCSTLGKEPIVVCAEDNAIWPVSYAVAVGFPTGIKYDQQDERVGLRMAMPCGQAIAEGIGSDGLNDEVQFYSEIEENPEIESLSGISGGPVFWSNSTKSGLLGFVKEALDTTTNTEDGVIGDKPRVNFVCQRVDYAILETWTDYIDRCWHNDLS